MKTLDELLNSRQHIVTTKDLLSIGCTSHQMTVAVRSGRLRRIRNGWYASVGADPAAVWAVRVGGRLGGFSAAAYYGLVTPEHTPLTVNVNPNACRLRTGAVTSDTEVVWRELYDPAHASHIAVSLFDCLRQVAMAPVAYEAIACLDSALRIGTLDDIDRELLRQSLPRRYRRRLDQADSRSDGFPESVARVRLSEAGIPVQLQVAVLSERWIDMVVGDRLALEIDGRGKYLNGTGGDPLKILRKFEAEKKRDAHLASLGYLVLHLTYEMVVYDWPGCLALIQAVMERGDHLHRPELRLERGRRGVSRTSARRVVAAS
jgi:very-short-patch-repair endonuclease